MKITIKPFAKALVCLFFALFSLNKEKLSAQSLLTVSDFHRFTTLSFNKVIEELKSKSFYIVRKNELPNETQIVLTIENDPNRILTLIYHSKVLSMLDYETTYQEQKYIEKSSLSSGYKFQENLYPHGSKAIIKYSKDGGLKGQGLELDFSSSSINKHTFYSVFFWNWHTDAQNIISLYNIPNPKDIVSNKTKFKKFKIANTSFQKVFDFFNKKYRGKAIPFGNSDFNLPINMSDGDSCILVTLEQDNNYTTITFSNQCD